MSCESGGADLGRNFDDFVCDAYAYLMDNYRQGDFVYIFGFSRGAYVARTLAGMIQKVGMPRRYPEDGLKSGRAPTPR